MELRVTVCVTKHEVRLYVPAAKNTQSVAGQQHAGTCKRRLS